MSGALIKRNWDTNIYNGKIMWRHWNKLAIYKTRRVALEETNSKDTLTSNFQRHLQILLLEVWKKKFCCLSHSVRVFCYGSPSKLIQSLTSAEGIKQWFLLHLLGDRPENHEDNFSTVLSESHYWSSFCCLVFSSLIVHSVSLFYLLGNGTYILTCHTSQ